MLEPVTDRGVAEQVWTGITPSWYKVNLPRGLSGGGAGVVVGDRHGLLQVRPVGRVQILGKIAGYTEVMQERQAGHDSAAGKMVSRQWRFGVGYNPGDQSGDPVGAASYLRSEGAGDSALQGSTEGDYRSLAGVSDLYVARFAVDNTLLLDDGTEVQLPGEVVMLLDAAEVNTAHAANPARFHDLTDHGVLPPPPTTPASTIPASTIPASTIPASTIPASTIPASTIPASTIPASTDPVTVPAPAAGGVCVSRRRVWPRGISGMGWSPSGWPIRAGRGGGIWWLTRPWTCRWRGR